MLATLMLTAWLMGLAGSPHCLAMCAAPCAGVAQACGGAGPKRALLCWHVGRALGYALAGTVAAVSMQWLGAWGERSAMLRPVWSIAQVAALALGLWLLVRGRQPAWFARWTAPGALPDGRQPVHGPGRGLRRAGWIGVGWALMPCGLLYSALVVAALAGTALAGALVMLSFAVGSGVMLAIGPWLWLRLGVARLGGGTAAGDRWAIRLAGGLLVASAGWALVRGLQGSAAAQCLPVA